MESLVRNRVVDYEEVEQLRACASEALSNGASLCREWDSHIEGLNTVLQSIRGQVSGEYISATFVSALQSANTPMYNEEYDELSESVSRNLDKLVNRYQEADLESAHAIALICDDLKICEEMLKELKSHVTNVFDTGCESSQFKTTLSKVNRYKEHLNIFPTTSLPKTVLKVDSVAAKDKIATWIQDDYIMSKEEIKEARQYIREYRNTRRKETFSNLAKGRTVSVEESKIEEEITTLENKISIGSSFTAGLYEAFYMDKLFDVMWEPLNESYGTDISWDELTKGTKTQNPYAHGAGKIVGTVAEYSAGAAIVKGIPVLNKVATSVGKAFKSKAVEGIVADTFVDITLDTIPNTIKDIKSGKSGMETTQNAVKNIGWNVALNAGSEIAIDVGKIAGRKIKNVNFKTSYGKSSESLSKAKGWNVGDPIDNLTKAGNEPSWSTVKSRYWKNEAYYNSELYTESDLLLMKKGNAPRHPEVDVPMELHHINGRNIENPHNQQNLMSVWPWEHSDIDPFRFYTDPKPGGN